MDYYTELELCNTCANRGKLPRCKRELRDEWQLAQGCYPCECLHVIGEMRHCNDPRARHVSASLRATWDKCPYSRSENFKPGLFGCPLYQKDGDTYRGSFCPYGVREVRILRTYEENNFAFCEGGELYEFDPSSDLRHDSHQWIVRGTTLKKECAVKGVHCVRDFIQAYTPKTLDSIKGIGEKKLKEMYHFISIHGYEPHGDEWHKRSVEEQKEWLARFELDELVKRENARLIKREAMRQKRLQNAAKKQENKEGK